MALEIFTGTQAECNAVITKVNTALGYTGSTSICIPYPIDSTNDIYEVLVKTGTQKNALNTNEKTKVLATRSFENQDKENAKNMSTLERPEIGFKKITRLDLTIPKGAVLLDRGQTITVSAIVQPTDATDKTKFHWSTSDEINGSIPANNTGATCVVTSGNKSRGQTVTIKCNSTDGSRVFGSIQLTIQ
tara:strand:+ start:832 stop:1398 length:567 start_codon:yes stop_codon:yes gene_type:complete